MENKILWGCLAILLLIVIFGVIMTYIANSKCERICNGALTHEVFASGETFSNQNDVCVCYFKDSIKAFKLGDIK